AASPPLSVVAIFVTTTPTAAPKTTPTARLLVARVAVKTHIITNECCQGNRSSPLGLTVYQEIVFRETMTITAASAAIGMAETTWCSERMKSSRKPPAAIDEKRVRARDSSTLTIVWPIMPQPPVPASAPAAMLATPWPQLSRVLLEEVMVIPSTS